MGVGGFVKKEGPDGKVMFALPPGAKIIKRSPPTQVILSASSLQSGRLMPVQVIPSDQDKENRTPPSQGSCQNITLAPEFVFPINHPPLSSDAHYLAEAKQRKLGRVGGGVKQQGYLYNTDSQFCVSTCQNQWRMHLRRSLDIADIATLLSMLHSHILWSEINNIATLTDNKYRCDEKTLVQRIIVDSRDEADEGRKYKIVVMKQELKGDETTCRRFTVKRSKRPWLI
eukprot:sb/3469566/